MRLAPDDSTILDFGSEFLVVCPHCGCQAWVRDRGLAIEPRIALTFPHCGLNQFWAPARPGILTGADPKRYPPDVVAMGGPVDWYFHLPLWLQIGCCGEPLEAYNQAHLAFMEDYVRATLRKHARGEHRWRNQALHNRLPRWMIDAQNRDDMLKCVERLRERFWQHIKGGDHRLVKGHPRHGALCASDLSRLRRAHPVGRALRCF